MRDHHLRVSTAWIPQRAGLALAGLGLCALLMGAAQDPQGGPNAAAAAPAQAQTSQAPAQVPSEEAADEPAPIQAFAGSLEAGLAEMQRRAQEINIADAEEFAQRLMVPKRLDRVQSWLQEHAGFLGARGQGMTLDFLDWLGLASRTAEQRAVVHYDLGLLQAQAEAREPARASFESSIYLAAGPTRELGTYNLGCLDLTAAEELFQQIPEVHGRTRSAMSPGFVPSTQQGDEEEPDYLKLSRAKYKAALGHFVQRLRLNWQDADTRANVEWIQNRLEELRKIEEKRQSDEGQGMAEDDPSQDQENQPTEDEQQDGGEQGAKSEQEQSEDAQQQESEGPEGESGEENERQEREEERLLTEEEIKRLLKRLEQHDKEGERLRQLVQPRPRGRVKKDW